MSKRDYYAVLDLQTNCTPLEIRQNFKRLALRWHPDKCFDKTEAQHKFNEINEAYTVLSDNRKKQIYDVHGHKGIEMDQENGNQGVFAQENFFFRKGFRGTQKSAFDLLKDILIDSDEDEDVFANKEELGASETLKATLQSFMEDEDFTHSTDAGASFFESYKPTFMNPEFLLPPPGFDGEIHDASYTANIFSFFTSSSDEKSYISTSTTVTPNGATINSLHETFTNNQNNVNTTQTSIIFEDAYKKPTPSANNNKSYDEFYTSMFNNNAQDPIIVINDYEDEPEPLELPKKDIKLTIKRTSDEIIEELNAQLRDQVSLKSKKISKDKDCLNIRLMNKKPSKKNRS